MTPPSSVPAPAEDIVEAFGAALTGTGRALLSLPDLLAAWDVADPGWAGTHAGRMRLSEALDRLDAVRVIELPSRSGSRWDPALPRLPTRIAIPSNRRHPARALDPSSEPWLPALSWAGNWIRRAHPPQRQRLALVAINRWLASTLGRTVPIVCREERSLQIFDDEKVLASLTGTALFEPRRLTLGMLACEPPVGGVRIARLADEGPVLVVENKAIFDSAWRALRRDVDTGRRPGYAAVVFGGGDAAASLIPDLLVLRNLVGVRPTSFEYAGDIDVAGVSAAAAFIDSARSFALAASPAMALWTALGTAEPAGEDFTGDLRERQAALVAVTHLCLPEIIATRLRDRLRIPQERLDRVALADTSWWAPCS